MDLNKMLSELMAERKRVDEAIALLEQLGRTTRTRGGAAALISRGGPIALPKRRGRPKGSKNKPKQS